MTTKYICIRALARNVFAQNEEEPDPDLMTVEDCKIGGGVVVEAANDGSCPAPLEVKIGDVEPMDGNDDLICCDLDE